LNYLVCNMMKVFTRPTSASDFFFSFFLYVCERAVECFRFCRAWQITGHNSMVDIGNLPKNDHHYWCFLYEYFFPILWWSPVGMRIEKYLVLMEVKSDFSNFTCQDRTFVIV
jgi:hypothetical protein